MIFLDKKPSFPRATPLELSEIPLESDDEPGPTKRQVFAPRTCLDLFVAQDVTFAVALRIIWPNFYPRSGNNVRRYTRCLIVSMEVHSDWKIHHDSL